MGKKAAKKPSARTAKRPVSHLTDEQQAKLLKFYDSATVEESMHGVIMQLPGGHCPQTPIDKGTLDMLFHAGLIESQPFIRWHITKAGEKEAQKLLRLAREKAIKEGRDR